MRNIALGRTLTTQGAVIRLPQSVTIGDQFAVPSLGAALLLGLHEQVGGSPDHIDIAAISEPIGHDGLASEALLLHDIVPGGTGYLAELANPERMWDLLHRAWEKVRDCPCQHEQRLACHRCLVPFAPISVGGLSRVSRSAAERHLRAILTSGVPDATPGDTMSWSLTTHEPGLRSPESHLEQSFRKVFTERVTALGATVKETPGPMGNRLSITFPGGVRQWTLEPQVQMHGCRPDFVLRSSQGGLPAVAIFTDGWLYHASPAHNRIADDARKRQDLRDSGVIVLGITAQDVARAESGTSDAPAWLNDGVIAELMRSGATFRPQNVEAIRRGPVDFLLAWIQNPDVDGCRGLADQIPFLFAPSARHFQMDATADLAREAALLLLDPDHVPPAGDPGSVSLVVGGRLGRLPHHGRKGQSSKWRWWSMTGRIISLTRIRRPTAGASGCASPTPSISGSSPPSSPHLPTRRQKPGRTTRSRGSFGILNLILYWKPEWRSAHDLPPAPRSGPSSRLSRGTLSGDAGTVSQVPSSATRQTDGIPVDFAWPDKKIAVFLDLDAEDPRVLELADWRVFGDDPDAVFAALKEAA